MSTWNDIRYSTRVLLRDPGFASVAILTLALGVGANTAIFSIVNGVLLRPLPYRNPDRLVSIREVIPQVAKTYPTLPVNAFHFTQWRQRGTVFENLSAVDTGTAALTGSGEPEMVDIARTSADIFETLGVAAARGRSFVQGEDQAGRDHVAVITDSLWRRRFSADPGVIGRTIQLDSRPYTVIGVLPASFRFPNSRVLDVGQITGSKPEVFRTLVFDDDELKELMGRFNYSVIAKLRPGVQPERARAELNVIAGQLEKIAGEKVDLQAWVQPMRDSVVAKTRRGLLVLLGAVGSVLLIVCVNLATLQLARAEKRASESAVRMAFGASGGQLVRQALTETILIALAGGALGVAVAAASLGALVRSAPADIPRLDEVTLDPTVLLFALAITTLTGVLFGLAPAWRAARVDPQAALKSGGRTMAGTAPGARLRSLLVAAEVALSVVLLMSAGLLTRSFVRVMQADKGFQAPTALAAEVQIPMAKYGSREQRAAFFDRVIERLESQPGVASTAVVSTLPLSGENWVDMVWASGDTRSPWQRPSVNVRFISPEYFRTLGIPLLAGRTFAQQDRNRNLGVLSERIAQTLWPGERNPVGREFFDGGTKYEVIGVVGDVRAEAHKPAVAILYRPYWDLRWAPRTLELVARPAGDPRSVAGAMRAAVHSVDADVPVPEVRTMQTVLEDSVAQRRFQMALVLAFAGTALLLATLGIYGVVSYSVARRRNEMGLRMALGAQARDVYGIVLAKALSPVAAGLVAGIAGALAAGRVLASLLYEVSPQDPVILSSVAAVLLAVAVAASLAPARRAVRIAPLEALRYE